MLEFMTIRIIIKNDHRPRTCGAIVDCESLSTLYLPLAPRMDSLQKGRLGIEGRSGVWSKSKKI